MSRNPRRKRVPKLPKRHLPPPKQAIRPVAPQRRVMPKQHRGGR